MSFARYPLSVVRYRLSVVRPSTAYRLLSTFCLLLSLSASAQAPKSKDTLTFNGEKLRTRVQFQPEFPGGKDSLTAFFDRNLSVLGLRSTSGSVVVTFIIDKEGKIFNPTVVQKFPGHPELDAEALRVVQLMPQWQPAVHLGKKVHCVFTMPISFSSK
jgi:TonB family protein